MGNLEGQGAIVTGGAWGIGGATARRLARDGARVLIADLDGDGGAENVARIAEAGGAALSMVVDLRDGEQFEAMVRRAVEEWGRLDVLVQTPIEATRRTRGAR